MQSFLSEVTKTLGVSKPKSRSACSKPNNCFNLLLCTTILLLFYGFRENIEVPSIVLTYSVWQPKPGEHRGLVNLMQIKAYNPLHYSVC